MTKKGTEYELFVQKIMQAIVDSEPYAQQKNIKIEHNVHLTDRTGTKRQFDIYWEYQIAGFSYKTIVECKDYNTPISISKVDEIIGKLHDLPDIKPIIATRKGFQDGAIEKAKSNNVELIIVRDEDIEKDWTSPDGEPLLRTIKVELHLIRPIQITRFKPVVDREWAIANKINSLRVSALANEIFIVDVVAGERKILNDYENLIPQNEGKIEIKKTFRKTFENAFLETKEIKIKIKAIEFDYIAPPQEIRCFEVSPEFVGVVEYLNHSMKKVIIKNGDSIVINDWELKKDITPGEKKYLFETRRR